MVVEPDHVIGLVALVGNLDLDYEPRPTDQKLLHLCPSGQWEGWGGGQPR